LDSDGLYKLKLKLKLKLKKFFKNLTDKTDKTQSKVTLKIAKILAQFNHPFYKTIVVLERYKIY